MIQNTLVRRVGSALKQQHHGKTSFSLLKVGAGLRSYSVLQCNYLTLFDAIIDSDVESF